MKQVKRSRSFSKKIKKAGTAGLTRYSKQVHKVKQEEQKKTRTATLYHVQQVYNMSRQIDQVEHALVKIGFNRIGRYYSSFFSSCCSGGFLAVAIPEYVSLLA